MKIQSKRRNNTKNNLILTMLVAYIIDKLKTLATHINIISEKCLKYSKDLLINCLKHVNLLL